MEVKKTGIIILLKKTPKFWIIFGAPPPAPPVLLALPPPRSRRRPPAAGRVASHPPPHTSARGRPGLVRMAASTRTTVVFTVQRPAPPARAFLGENLAPPLDDDEGGDGGGGGHPNAFFVAAAAAPTRADLRRAFPLGGAFHFRCLTRARDAWVDLTDDDDALVLQGDGSCVVKALDLGPLLDAAAAEEEKGDDGLEGEQFDMEAEYARIDAVAASYAERPPCPAVDTIPRSGGGGNGNGDGGGGRRGAAAAEKAKDVAKAATKSVKQAASSAKRMLKGFFKS